MFSAAKLFFAYGLGNALTFPLAVGATSVLTAQRPSRRPRSPASCGGSGRPSFAACRRSTMRCSPIADLPRPEELALRRCVSAGEPLPQEIGRRWAARVGVDILDGIGSTEMLHIFLSNRPRRFALRHHRQASTRLRAADRRRGGPAGQPGRDRRPAWSSGPTSAAGYWNNRERSRATFRGEWTRTGDKYYEDQDGYYVYCGRSDDMMKVNGMDVLLAETSSPRRR